MVWCTFPYELNKSQIERYLHRLFHAINVTHYTKFSTESFWTALKFLIKIRTLNLRVIGIISIVNQSFNFFSRYIIFFAVPALTTKGRVSAPQCPSNWNKQGNTCYKVYSAVFSRSWNNANKVCQASRASLVSITSSSEQAVVSTLMKRKSENSYGFWIGLKRVSNNAFS